MNGCSGDPRRGPYFARPEPPTRATTAFVRGALMTCQPFGLLGNGGGGAFPTILWILLKSLSLKAEAACAAGKSAAEARFLQTGDRNFRFGRCDFGDLALPTPIIYTMLRHPPDLRRSYGPFPARRRQSR